MLTDIRNRLRDSIRPPRYSEGFRFFRGGQSRPSAGVAALCLQVAGQIGDCGVLKEKAWIDASSHLLACLGLPSHHDRQKDWDSLKVLGYILRECGTDTAILDAGSGSRSVILNWLFLLGYRRLFACDRVTVNDRYYRRRGIAFSVQDMARTTYGDGSFGAIACVSVIEHGVDLTSFLIEMRRLLRPGGLLLVSTDYWPEPIDTRGIYPYGEQHGEMRVFTREEAENFCLTAQRTGFEPCGPVDFAASVKAVRWERVNRDYTFLFMAFRKA